MMSEPLVISISRPAAKLVEPYEQRGAGAVLDFSRASLTIVEEIAREAAQWSSTLSPGRLMNLLQNIGLYLLETGRREHG